MHLSVFEVKIFFFLNLTIRNICKFKRIKTTSLHKNKYLLDVNKIHTHKIQNIYFLNIFQLNNLSSIFFFFLTEDTATRI